jgi:hypothetical protein
MYGNLNTALSCRPTQAEIERRRAALLATVVAPDQKPLLPAPAQSTPLLSESALYGLAGTVIRTLAPHTESHPAAILLQFLAAFGNLVGPGPHCMVNATRHPLNLFVVLVGDSGNARKGTSWAQLTRLFAEVDHSWLTTRVSTARLTTAALRDSSPQPTDPRLLVLSEEFASVLGSLHHRNNHLSPLLRHIWDHGRLLAPDLHQHRSAADVHLSLVAHITQHELAHTLNPAETRNGFANRCLWTSVRRTNCLPDGGSADPREIASIATELRRALSWATAAPDILFHRNEAASELWHQRYAALSQVNPSLRSAASSRAEAQVLRLSAIYAALDASASITRPHLEAALAVWEYCSASARTLFGKSTGDPIADRVREAIDASPSGLSQYQIRRLFHGHIETPRIEAALNQLMVIGAISPRTQTTGGRPATRWSTLAEKQAATEQNSDDDL